MGLLYSVVIIMIGIWIIVIDLKKDHSEKESQCLSSLVQPLPESNKDPEHYKSSELIQCIPTTIAMVQGRLREHSEFWIQELECSKFV